MTGAADELTPRSGWIGFTLSRMCTAKDKAADDMLAFSFFGMACRAELPNRFAQEKLIVRSMRIMAALASTVIDGSMSILVMVPRLDGFMATFTTALDRIAHHIF